MPVRVRPSAPENGKGLWKAYRLRVMKRYWEAYWFDDGLIITLKAENGHVVEITPLLNSPESLESEVKTVKQELDDFLKKILAQWQERLSKSSDPKEIWKSMIGMTEGEMIEHFNALEENTRRKVADYVFSNVNMFSGKGLIFAQLYDHNSAILLSD